jgi:hypothetical protein
VTRDELFTRHFIVAGEQDLTQPAELLASAFTDVLKVDPQAVADVTVELGS